MKISVILTAWREERTVGFAVERIIEELRKLDEDSELLLVCPDDGTYRAGKKVADRESFPALVHIKDPGKGKPAALNLALSQVHGDIIISTDGDVRIGGNSLKVLVQALSGGTVEGATGRPVCADDRDTLWGYWGHMFMDAAHKKRMETLKRGLFYAMSGYLLAFRKGNMKVPDGVLDDVYFSYAIHDRGGRIIYVPEAKVYVKQPANLSDWLKQKVRSIAGYQQLGRYFPDAAVSRSFQGDLAYAWFPISYAENLREVLWSLLQYPVRLYIWAWVWFEMNIRKRTAVQLWKRIETTK